MKKPEHRHHSEFTLERVESLKGQRRLYVVFSTFGEREADLIHEKISLISAELGSIVDRIFLSHRRADPAKEESTETRAREARADVDIVLCNSFDVPDMGDERGKGADMRRTLYHINRSGAPSDSVVVFLDADVVTEYFGAHFVLGLAGAVLEGKDFAKAGFWRAMGRVKKFVAQPLFSVIEHPKISGLRDFSYPLSGEVAGTLDFFNAVHFWQIYGVETGINIDAAMGEFRVADVNLGLYDHEHHGEVNIQKMAFGIIRTWLMQLVDYGLIELKQGASVSDLFRASYIDSDASMKTLDFDLTEKKYTPLKDILS